MGWFAIILKIVIASVAKYWAFDIQTINMATL